VEKSVSTFEEQAEKESKKATRILLDGSSRSGDDGGWRQEGAQEARRHAAPVRECAGAVIEKRAGCTVACYVLRVFARKDGTAMTAQINDTFRYREREYAIAGISEGELFDPSLLDLKPAGTCTACWRGYQAVFALSDSRLILDALHINLLKPGKGYEREKGATINGVKPTGPSGEYDWFNNHYAGLRYYLEYTGGLLLADGFIQELYVHMGFHPAWKYERVVELIFEAGILKREFDRSARMAEIRRRFHERIEGNDSERMPTEDEVTQFVKRAFDRSYRM
jgi:hypothetical protein